MKIKIDRITGHELKDYIKKHGGSIVTRENIKISLKGENVFCIEDVLEEDNDGRYVFYDEVRGADELMNVFNMLRLKDIQEISRLNMCVRWLTEKSELVFVNTDSKKACFRIFREETWCIVLN